MSIEPNSVNDLNTRSNQTNSILTTASNPQSIWLGSTVGQYLQVKEQALYDSAVVDLFGFNALQMGCIGMDLLRNSRIPSRYIASEFNDAVHNANLLCCDDFLPFAEMSLDLLLLPHRLEFSERPHQTLREAERVMMPEGHLLISGFNPASAWGTRAFVNRMLSKKATLPNKFPWNGHFIGLTRMKDWLKLLGFEIISVEMSCHTPPFEQSTWQKRFSYMEKMNESVFSKVGCNRLGGIYFIVAKKRVAGMTRIKPNWKKASLTSGLVIKPTQSNTPQITPTQTSQAKSI